MADVQKLNVNNTTYDISTTWSKVTGKPSTFPPESHTHNYIVSPYYYNQSVISSDTTADTIFGENSAKSKMTCGFMSGHPLFGGYADVAMWTGYCKWGGTQFATEYNAINPRVAIRKYSQTRSNWGNWTEFITTANIGTQSVNYANSAGSVAWTGVTGKPSTFPPDSHTHSYLPLTGGTVSGTITATGFYQSSDERLKTFHDPIKVDLEKLKLLKKNYFKFNDKDKLEIGISAQEIQEIYPEIVSSDDNGYLSVAYDKLSVIALSAIDELDNINNKQQKEIDDLKDQLKAIKNILNEKGIL